MTKQDMTDFYMNFLAGEGYRPTVDGDGDVVFKHEGKLHLLMISESDPIYFRLICPLGGIASFMDTEHLDQILAAANEVTLSTKVAKAYVRDKKLSVAIEMFVSPMEQITPVFGRCMSALDTGVRSLLDELRKAGLGL